jgi:two-component system response regulator CpxR
MPEPVLLIEDDVDVREIVGQAIIEAGYPAVEIGSGQTALEYLRANPPPRLILLDWHLPALGGAELMHEVMKTPELAAIPVVLMSGDADAGKGDPAMSFAGHLTKPFTWDALLGVLKKFLPT